MERKMYWLMSRALTPYPMLSFSFSPRARGNHWLFHEQLVEDKPIILGSGIDTTFAAEDPNYLANLAFGLIDRSLTYLSGQPIFPQIFTNKTKSKIKIVVHLTRANFTQSQYIKLANIVEEQELQDLIVLRGEPISIPECLRCGVVMTQLNETEDSYKQGYRWICNYCGYKVKWIC